jgi:hypothetical protein
MEGISRGLPSRHTIELDPDVVWEFFFWAYVNANIPVSIGVKPHGVGRVAHVISMQIAGRIGLGHQDNRGLDLGFDGETLLRSDLRHGVALG